MKPLASLLLIGFLPLMIACQTDANLAQDSNLPEGVAYVMRAAEAAAPASAPAVKLEMKPVRDPNTGRVTSYLPLPADWNIVATPQGPQGYEGPNGISVTSRPTELYYFNIDPYVARMTGKQLARPTALAGIFQQTIAPDLQRRGYQLIRQYPLDEIGQRSRQLMQGALNRSQVQRYDIIASEWQQPNGKKSLVLASQMVMHAQGGSSWGLGVTELQAPAREFDYAKETYLFAQAHWEVDRNTAMAHAAELNRMDRESEQRMAASRDAHNARMRSNEAAFQATQRAHTEASSAINDMSMQGYWDRSASQDRLQQQEVNAIHEEYTMTNPWDSNRSLQVQSGYQQYYMNAHGDVIGSNDANFNPNVHQGFNHTEWRPLPQGQR